MTPITAGSSNPPNIHHAAAPVTPAVAVAPSKRPKIERSTGATNTAARIARKKKFSLPDDCDACFFFSGGGSASPSMTEAILSTPL